MVDSLKQSPGTVSEILWHFTGGPKWNEKKKRQNKTPKPAKEAYKILKSIIRSKELRLGQYIEVIKVILPYKRQYNPRTNRFDIKNNVPVELTSAPVCCLADIPKEHLEYHANRYGKFAIGFHRSDVTRFGFNPVFYILKNAKVLHSIYEGYTELAFHDSLHTIDTNNGLSVTESNCLNEMKLEKALAISGQFAKGRFEKFLGFVKTFDQSEFGTIYCEREWRSLESYTFDFDELAMIVLPKRVGSNKYFDDFVSNEVTNLGIPSSIPIVPWEDLTQENHT